MFSTITLYIYESAAIKLHFLSRNLPLLSSTNACRSSAADSAMSVANDPCGTNAIAVSAASLWRSFVSLRMFGIMERNNVAGFPWFEEATATVNRFR